MLIVSKALSNAAYVHRFEEHSVAARVTSCKQQNSQGVIFLVTEDSACCDNSSSGAGRSAKDRCVASRDQREVRK